MLSEQEHGAKSFPLPSGTTSVSMDMLFLLPTATSVHRNFVTHFCMPF